MILAWIIDTYQGDDFKILSAGYSLNMSDVTAVDNEDIAALTPNSAVIQIKVSAATFALIEADNDYYVLWSENV